MTDELWNSIMNAIMTMNTNTAIETVLLDPQVDPTIQTSDQNQLTKMIASLQAQVQVLTDWKGSFETSSVDINPKMGKYWKYYCYTHGCRNHCGYNCKNKATGYKDKDTLHNRMEGSNKNCLTINNWQVREGRSLINF